MPKLDFTTNGTNLTINDGFDLPKYTIIVGKNNSGKSWLSRSLYHKLEQSNQNPSRSYYISPERFGILQRSAGLEDASFSNGIGRDREKLKNQSSDFITESISKFNGLIAQLNRSPEQTKEIREIFLKNLNNKISNLVFSYTDSSESTSFHFKINNRYPNPDTDNFSSGTNQIIALMTSVMYFLYSGKYTKDSVLLLDEPDVHIHPDLQIEFVKFLTDITKNTEHKILIATHSSSIISGFKSIDDSYIGTIKGNELEFTKIDDITSDILPSLGTHSLSHVFNQSPLLLVEGDDDYIIWNHAIRKSKGKINFHLVDVMGKDNFIKYEKIILKISPQLFDNPKAFEIWDADEDSNNELKKDLQDENFIKKSYLNCREIENLILSNEVLKTLNIDSWDEAKIKIETNNKYKDINRSKIKIDQEYELINLLSNTNSKSWEQLVGEAIGKNITNKDSLVKTEGSIYNMLGEKISSWIG